jgi:hypothetical protein
MVLSNLSQPISTDTVDTNGPASTNDVGLFLNDESNASMEAIAEHVQYVGQLVG